MVGVLGKPRYVWYEYWLNPGMYGMSTGWTQVCMVWVLVEPRYVWLEYWVNPGMYGMSTGWTQVCMVGVQDCVDGPTGMNRCYIGSPWHTVAKPGVAYFHLGHSSCPFYYRFTRWRYRSCLKSYSDAPELFHTPVRACELFKTIWKHRGHFTVTAVQPSVSPDSMRYLPASLRPGPGWKPWRCEWGFRMLSKKKESKRGETNYTSEISNLVDCSRRGHALDKLQLRSI